MCEGVGLDTRSAAQRNADLSFLQVFATIRAMHLVQMVFSCIAGRRSYRRPWLAAAAVAVLLTESGWLARRWTRQAGMDGYGAAVDTALAAAALVVMGEATRVEDLTTSLNWAVPAAVCTAAGVGTTMKGRDAAAASAVLAASHAVSFRRAVAHGSNPFGIAVSLIAYPGLVLVARVVTGYVHTYSHELEDLRARSVEDSTRLATEQERNRQHRVLHDSALQTLEAIGAGWTSGSVHLRADAAREAARLRRWLNGQTADADTLETTLGALAAEFVGLHIEIVCDHIDPEPPPTSAIALSEASREALRNVAKHAGVRRAVLRCTAAAERIEITIRDHGHGYDPHTTPQSFGTTSSITARLEECGGGAEITSTPGRGTRVKLWAPR